MYSLIPEYIEGRKIRKKLKTNILYAYIDYPTSREKKLKEQTLV